MKDSLGDRIKSYEKMYSPKVFPLLPVIARLDGRCFSNWTKGLSRPFDHDMMDIMQGTTKELVHLSGALLGYTQSDEITLVFYSDDPKSQVFFDGKVQKMCSVLASMCTAEFAECLNNLLGNACEENNHHSNEVIFKLGNKPPATFDCRIFQVPTLEEVVNCLIWREQDAVRNSILAVGQSKFSHQEMHNKSCAEVQEMLFQAHGINWGEDFSDSEKRGTYFRRVKTMRPFTFAEIQNLPPKHEARTNPSLIIERHDIKEMNYPILTKIENRVDVIFNGAEPILKSDKNPTELESDIGDNNESV